MSTESSFCLRTEHGSFIEQEGRIRTGHPERAERTATKETRCIYKQTPKRIILFQTQRDRRCQNQLLTKVTYNDINALLRSDIYLC
jgi:hypothetical protein